MLHARHPDPKQHAPLGGVSCESSSFNAITGMLEPGAGVVPELQLKASALDPAWAQLVSARRIVDGVVETGTVNQLITAGATLAGVLLTLVTNAFLERRRARDAHALETFRLLSERAKWLRDERQKAYASLSIAGEEVLQFFRSELSTPIEPGGAGLSDQEARWRELRIELRKAYNQVALFGAGEVRAAGLRIWRTARNAGNDFFSSLQASSATSADAADVSEEMRKAISQLGTEGDRFLETCRKDLQGEGSGAPAI